MTEIGFYHLTRSTIDQALPRLLEKAYESGKRIVVRCPDEARLEHLDRFLWTYSPDSFLPHGTAAGDRPEHQPILLTSGEDRPNGATLLVTIEGVPYGDLSRFDRCLDLFDGAEPAAVEAARERWRWAKEAGHKLVYWQQNERGGWVKAREEG